MTLPPDNLVQTLDRFIREGRCFALHRLPWTEECILTLQQASEQPLALPSIAQLDGQQGFVMAPFTPSAATPIVCIRPDVKAKGWEEIERVLRPFGGDFAEEDRGEGEVRLADGTGETKGHPEKETADSPTYEEVFARFIHSLKEGDFRKLVLSRSETHAVGADFSPTQAFVRACQAYPRMMIYLCHTPLTGTWLGSTPEILLSGKGQTWKTVALAGTIPLEDSLEEGQRKEEVSEILRNEKDPSRFLSGNPDRLWSEKNREEQAMVAEYIREVLRPHCSEWHEDGPYTARAGQLLHLKTTFTFAPKQREHIGPLLEALHPTPAVCGLPKQEAREFILAHEGYDRRYYTGFVGMLDLASATDLYVNLRCMQCHADGQVTLYAGGGILPSSQCGKEWEETRQKMKTMKEIE
jgi:isochorismate synthase